MKILVADDDRDLVELIRHTLEREGHTVRTSFDGTSTLQVFQSERPDLVILDLMMPRQNGMDVLREIRRQDNIPIIVLSALHDEDHIVGALFKGADDYMTKPFGPRELRARTRALLRRSSAEGGSNHQNRDPLILGQISLDPRNRETKVGESKVRLTRTEFELLRTLMVNHARVMSHSELLSQVWGYDGEQNSEVVKVTISRLRQKLAEAGALGCILSVQGIGYRFNDYN